MIISRLQHIEYVIKSHSVYRSTNNIHLLFQGQEYGSLSDSHVLLPRYS